MKMKLILGGGALLLVIIAVVATLFLTGSLGGSKAEGEEGAGGTTGAAEPVKTANRFDAAEYYTFAQEFMVPVNTGDGRKRYMKLGLTISTFDTTVIPAIEQHMPAIRDRLFSTLSNRERDVLMTDEGKEALRQEVLQKIQEVMIERFGNKGIDEVFFNEFLMD